MLATQLCPFVCVRQGFAVFGKVLQCSARFCNSFAFKIYDAQQLAHHTLHRVASTGLTKHLIHNLFTWRMHLRFLRHFETETL